MVRKLHSASEIARMGLPGLPTSRDNIRARAEREGWYHEATTGKGGTRLVYEIPERYLSEGEQPQEKNHSTKVIGQITPGGANVNLESLRMADMVLEEWLQQKNLRLKPERRAGVLAVLCDYLEKGATKDDMRSMLNVLSA